MRSRFATRALMTTALVASLGFAGAMSSAEAMPAHPIGLADAPSLVETVRSTRHRYVRPRRHNGAAAAIALGVLGLAAGAAIANSQPDYYYGPGYYYGGPGYYYGGPRYYGHRHYNRSYASPRGYYAPRRGYYGGYYRQAPTQPAPEGAGRL